MTESARDVVLPQYVISLDPQYGLGTQAVMAALAAPTGIAWPNANRAYFWPFTLPLPALVARMFVANGPTVSGNIDVGIYAVEAGTSASLIVSAGGVANAGTSAVQFFNVTHTVLPAGSYYFALSFNNTSANPRGVTPTVALRANLFGTAMMESAYPLPATATLAQAATGHVWLMGFSERAGV